MLHVCVSRRRWRRQTASMRKFCVELGPGPTGAGRGVRKSFQQLCRKQQKQQQTRSPHFIYPSFPSSRRFFLTLSPSLCSSALPDRTFRTEHQVKIKPLSALVSNRIVSQIVSALCQMLVVCHKFAKRQRFTEERHQRMRPKGVRVRE